MTNQPLPQEVPLGIKTPCPKTWDQLTGGESKRFCSECSLHVHNAAQLTRHEAQELVSKANQRVCMRMQLDPQGEPIFRDSKPAMVLPRIPFAARATRWALATAAGLLAACHRSESPNTRVGSAPNMGTTQTSTIMGKVAPTERLGDVAIPQPEPPERLGEANYVAAPEPPVAPTGKTPPNK